MTSGGGIAGIGAGPWSGGHPCDSWTLTRAEVVGLLVAVPDRAKMVAALEVARLSDRKADRALQLLRRAGLIRYSTGGRRWDHTDAGRRAALQAGGA